MSKCCRILQYILFIHFAIFTISFVYAGNNPDDECHAIPAFHPDQDFADISYKLPSNGQFDGGTTGWTIDTSGFGIVTSYAAANEGWVGLRCTGAQTAAIEYGPISISTSTTIVGSSTTYQGYDWDWIAFCIHFRGNTTYNSLIAGRFQIQAYDAIGSEVQTFCALDASSSAVGVDSTGNASPTTWSAFAFQFTPPHQNWYRISKIRLSYSVPSGVNTTTEVQIDQVYLLTSWMKNW